ncbi:MAG: hypothetical protein JWQ40_815 [Segetibacter sp.]|nr:hypothetical protein [Segetibacter sp.]
MKDSVKKDKSFDKNRIPIPLATGWIGLLIAYVLPAGFSGTSGFLVGLLIGFAFIVLMDTDKKNKTKREKLDSTENQESYTLNDHKQHF